METPLDVDDGAPQIDGHAYVRAEQGIALLQRRLLKPFSCAGTRIDLTLTQYHALSFLASRGSATVSEMKAALGFAQSTTSTLVGRLVQQGLIEKSRHRNDHRMACIIPLPKGLRLVQRFRKNTERNLQILMAHLGEQALSDLFEALECAAGKTAPLENSVTTMHDDRRSRRAQPRLVSR